MPEQITRHPDVTIQVLKSAGARCGEGLEQKILKKCPPENFCKLPGGEICVYGIEEIPNMTQITAADLAPVVCPDRNLALGGQTETDLAVLGGFVVVALAWRLSRKG